MLLQHSPKSNKSSDNNLICRKITAWNYEYVLFQVFYISID